MKDWETIKKEHHNLYKSIEYLLIKRLDIQRIDMLEDSPNKLDLEERCLDIVYVEYTNARRYNPNCIYMIIAKGIAQELWEEERSRRLTRNFNESVNGVIGADACHKYGVVSGCDSCCPALSKECIDQAGGKDGKFMKELENDGIKYEELPNRKAL